MKKLIIMACTMAMMLVTPIAANAANIYVGNQAGSGKTLTINAGTVFHLADGGTYGKCNNAWSYTCGTHAVLMYYSTRTGGSGTQTNPYVYSDCVFESCACQYNYYLSGTDCISCTQQTNHTSAVAVADKDGYHTLTSCDVCMSNQLMIKPAQGVINCVECPTGSTGCNGTTSFVCKANYYKNGYTCTACESGAESLAGSTKHSDCCYPEGYSETDSTGTWKYTSKCCYSN